jgi:hypothetical protein
MFNIRLISINRVDDTIIGPPVYVTKSLSPAPCIMVRKTGEP